MRRSASFDLGRELELVRSCLELRVPNRAVSALRQATGSAWVASGLSKTAAEIGSHIIARSSGCPAMAISPEQWHYRRITSCLPVLITYRGRNRDAQKVATALALEKAFPIVVITGTPVSPTIEILRRGGQEVHVLAAPVHRREAAFVAVRAVMVLSALATRLATSVDAATGAEALSVRLAHLSDAARASAEMVASKITSLPEWQSRTWTVITSGAPEPMRAMYQSLLGESGLAAMSWFDAADYAHGNYHAATNAPSRTLILVLSDTRASGMAALLNRRLGPLVPVFPVSFSGTTEEVIWTHLLAAILLIKLLARAADISLAHPRRPSQCRYWTRWDLT